MDYLVCNGRQAVLKISLPVMVIKNTNPDKFALSLELSTGLSQIKQYLV